MHTDTLTEEALWQAIAQLGRGEDQPQPDPRLVLADWLEERGERKELRESLRWASKETRRPWPVSGMWGFTWVWYDRAVEWKVPNPGDLRSDLFRLLPTEDDRHTHKLYQSAESAYEALATALAKLQEQTP